MSAVAEAAVLELRSRLVARRPEIEQAMLRRVYGISDPTDVDDPQYVDGLRNAISAAVDYAFGEGDGTAPGAIIPAPLLAQARLAAQNGIPLGIVLRRYVAGFNLLSDFALQEAVAGEPATGARLLQPLLHSHSALLDRLLEAVGDEHRRAAQELQMGTPDQRRMERVRRLLEGELVDVSGLGYPLDAWHVGLLATGPDAESRMRQLGTTLDRVVLIAQPDQDTTWAWLGGRRQLDADALHRELDPANPALRIGVGEPGAGLDGWRVTHRQAAAALPVAHRSEQGYVRYSEVALLASALQDDLLADSLRQLYLEPLEDERDGGDGLRKTLRAYLSTNGSLSSAATILDVSRRTISNRLLRVEELLGRPLHTVLADVDTALRLDDLLPSDATSRIGSPAST